jgi:hypothetical protein
LKAGGATVTNQATKTGLSNKVLAAQAGMSAKTYEKILRFEATQRIPFAPDKRYELRGEFERFRDGTNRIVWRAFYVGDIVRNEQYGIIVKPFPVYEIVKSTDVNMVAQDLADWLAKGE